MPYINELEHLKPYLQLLKFPLPTACIVGAVNLRSCYTAKNWIEQNTELGFIDAIIRESIVGDLTGNRWAWNLDNPVMFKDPIPAKGFQRIWNYSFTNQ